MISVVTSILCITCTLAAGEIGIGNEGLFSITPDQMLFASKLSEPCRRIYCHKFTMKQRQEALEEWKRGEDDGSETAFLTPDEAVEAIAAADELHSDNIFSDSSCDAR